MNSEKSVRLGAYQKMDEKLIEIPGQSYEESYLGFMIFIEPNPDRYRGGFEWSVCENNIELECGLDFSVGDALSAAKKSWTTLAPQSTQ